MPGSRLSDRVKTKGKEDFAVCVVCVGGGLFDASDPRVYFAGVVERSVTIMVFGCSFGVGLPVCLIGLDKNCVVIVIAGNIPFS